MGSVKVTVYGRLKPRLKSSVSQEYKLKYGDHEDQITFLLKSPVKKAYRFKKIFDESATQQQVFETVAKPVIENVLLGYNGTILTYGQTGSGKTHTMTGDIRDWTNTGLIPRTIQEIFKVKEKGTVITISYCEIYNEHVYDLIGPEGVDPELGSMNKAEDGTGLTNLRNVSVHTVTTVNKALQLFSRGDANKMIAETSSNARSSRSHVIFSIGMEIPHPEEGGLYLKPVLYLVDLAGSERLSKCKTSMGNPWETRFINLSLHYLEQVLVALRQPGRAHIPYRNSLMTALLRNSLGGNCITSMIATFSLSVDDVEETMQTCRFAERIALIKNELKLNELVSPERELLLLRKENERLRNQLKLLNNDQVLERLNEKDKEKCDEVVKRFIQENDFFELPLTDIRRMEYCFQLMRNELLKRKDSAKQGTKKVISTMDFPKAHGTFESSNQPEINLVEENVVQDKITRRKRNPMDLPKVNITYKRWKSTELLTEKENVPKPSSSNEPSYHRPNLCDFEVSNHEKLKNSEAKISLGCDSNTAPGTITNYKDYGMLTGSSNFKLKFPGETETEYKNLIPDITPKVSLQSAFLSQTLPVTGDNVNAEKSVSVEVEKEEKILFERNSVHDSLHSDDPKLKFPGETETEYKNLIPDNTPKLSLQSAFLSQTLPVTGDSVNAEKSVSAEVEKEEKILSERNSIHDSLNLDDPKKFSVDCVPLTGDKEVDEEILKFYQSRYRIFKEN